MCANYSQSLLATVALLGQHGYAAQPFKVTGNAIISYARAILVEKFMESGAEHLLLIDSDLMWDPMGALALVQSPHEFIGGIYPAKTPDMSKVFQSRYLRKTGSGKLLETDGVPGGFVRIKRSAIAKLQEAYPDIQVNYKGRPLHLLFENMIVEDAPEGAPDDERWKYRTPIGEDYAICERWRRIGGKVFVYPDIDFAHYGRKEWTGNLAHHLNEIEATQ